MEGEWAKSVICGRVVKNGSKGISRTRAPIPDNSKTEHAY